MALRTFQLRSQFDTHGAFWVPGDTPNTFTGRLARTKEGIKLTRAPVLNNVSFPFDFPGESDRLVHLHGFTAEGPCTLYYLHSAAPSGLADETGRAISFRDYRVGLCVFGSHLPEFESPLSGSVGFSYTGLHEWITVRPQISSGESAFVLTQTTDVPAIFDLSSRAIRSRVKLEIIPRFQQRPSGEYSTKHESRLLIEAAEPRSLEWYLEVAYRLEHVFSLLLGTSVALKSAEISHENKKGWLVRKTNHKAEKPDPSAWVRCNTLQLIQAVLSWLETPEEFRSLENLIYGTIRLSSLFVETEFLSLAQALESLHRITDRLSIADSGTFQRTLKKLLLEIGVCCENKDLADRLSESIQYANEPSFKVRIQRLLARLPEHCRSALLGDETKFEKVLRHTRNYFTHPGTQRKSHVLTAATDIFLLNQQLHGLLRLLMLMQIGIPAEQAFEPVLTQATKWH